MLLLSDATKIFKNGKTLSDESATCNFDDDLSWLKFLLFTVEAVIGSLNWAARRPRFKKISGNGRSQRQGQHHGRTSDSLLTWGVKKKIYELQVKRNEWPLVKLRKKRRIKKREKMLPSSKFQRSTLLRPPFPHFGLPTLLHFEYSPPSGLHRTGHPLHRPARTGRFLC